MEEQVPSSQVPAQPQEQPPAPRNPLTNPITPEVLEAMKARARELAIQQAIEQNLVQPSVVPAPPKNQNVVYVRRNLTVAELILIFALSCGLVTGIQAAWNFTSTLLPRLEIRVK